MQETDFDYEIIVHDDASIDGTCETLLTYADRYPNKFKLILQNENQWSQGVRGMFARFTFPQAQGKYIALCEGDDYWTDPLKLQKQVDLLEKTNAVLCHTHAKNSNSETISSPISIKRNDLQELANGNFIITATTMFRKEILKQHNWSGTYPFGDWPLWLTAGTQGDIVFLEDYTTVYRLNEQGVWQNNWKDRIGSDRILNEIQMLKDFKKFKPDLRGMIDDSIVSKLIKLGNYNYEMGSFRLNISKLFFAHYFKNNQVKSIINRSCSSYFQKKIGL
jgi:glycosyltransferase involved in cell wall biosynthesis